MNMITKHIAVAIVAIAPFSAYAESGLCDYVSKTADMAIRDRNAGVPLATELNRFALYDGGMLRLPMDIVQMDQEVIRKVYRQESDDVTIKRDVLQSCMEA